MHYIKNKLMNRAVLNSLILLLSLIISCQRKSNDKIEIEFFRSVSFDKETFGDGAFNICCIGNNDDFLVNYNKITKDIRYTSLVLKKTKKIPINDSLNFRMIFAKSIDSVFLISRKDSKVILIDSNGKIKDVYPIDLIKNGIKQRIVAITPNWISISKGKLFVNSYPSYKNRKTPYHRNSFNISIDLKGKDVSLIPITYPKIYTQKRWWGGLGNNFTHCVNHKGEIVFSFTMCDSLYVWNGKTIRSYLVERSKYLIDFPPEVIDNKKMMDSRYIIEYQRKNPRYSSIKFDDRLKIYYRVVAHGQELKNERGLNNLNFDRSWSVQIIDTNYIVIDEIFFDSGKYKYPDFLITKEGFCVSNDIRSEQDTIRWDFYKVKRL